MFCPNCGNRLSDDSAFCPSCGVNVRAGGANSQYAPPPQYQPQQQNYQPAPQQYYAPQPAKQGNTYAILGLVFAFLFPILGLVFSIMGYNESKRGAPYQAIAIAGIVISAIYVATFALIFIFFFALISAV